MRKGKASLSVCCFIIDRSSSFLIDETRSDMFGTWRTNNKFNEMSVCCSILLFWLTTKHFSRVRIITDFLCFNKWTDRHLTSIILTFELIEYENHKMKRKKTTTREQIRCSSSMFCAIHSSARILNWKTKRSHETRVNMH
jgi:hypothetical protein